MFLQNNSCVPLLALNRDSSFYLLTTSLPQALRHDGHLRRLNIGEMKGSRSIETYLTLVRYMLSHILRQGSFLLPWYWQYNYTFAESPRESQEVLLRDIYFPSTVTGCLIRWHIQSFPGQNLALSSCQARYRKEGAVQSRYQPFRFNALLTDFSRLTSMEAWMIVCGAQTHRQKGLYCVASIRRCQIYKGQEQGYAMHGAEPYNARAVAE